MSRLLLLATPLAACALAQGPRLTYLADPATELSFAHCYVHLDGGSRHKIPFLPVVNSAKGAPCGTGKYTRDIRLDAPIAFLGDGGFREDVDVAGKALLFCYDLPSKNADLEARVREAAARKAAGIVVFSWKNEQPFPALNGADVPEIPIIAVNRRAAAMILESGGLNSEEIFKRWESDGAFRPQVLISRLDLCIDGEFAAVDTPNFSLRFQKGAIPADKIAELAQVNERSVQFITELLKVGWRKVFTAYFPDFDSKLFYVHHWGSGLSSDAGVFMVFHGVPNFGLAVHENAHSAIGASWGGSTSFMNEGIGRYAEAMATDKDLNRREAARYLKDATVFPLAELVDFNIGPRGRTEIAYPAAGAFVQYVVETWSLDKLKQVYQLEGRSKEEKSAKDTWMAAFGKPLPQIEREWLGWLAAR